MTPGTPEFSRWVGLLFYVPALAGGIFGLLGGYLTDLFGRRRVPVWSILLYAFSAFAAGFSTSPEMLLFFRCTTFVGVSVEFVAAVAWLAELFPDPKRREAVLGGTQAFSSLGGLMVPGAYFLAVTYADSLPAIMGEHQAWRYTLLRRCDRWHHRVGGGLHCQLLPAGPEAAGASGLSTASPAPAVSQPSRT